MDERIHPQEQKESLEPGEDSGTQATVEIGRRILDPLLVYQEPMDSDEDS